jgi:hypothetical protein
VPVPGEHPDQRPQRQGPPQLRPRYEGRALT